MNDVKICLTDTMFMPERAHDTDAGYDLKSTETFNLMPKERITVGTGVSIQLPVGYEAQIRPRSGLANKHGIMIVNTPGTIDAGYIGEIKVILFNSGDKTVTLNKGERIAQMVFNKVEHPKFIEVTTLEETDRGSNGLGSTGLN